MKLTASVEFYAMEVLSSIAHVQEHSVDLPIIEAIRRMFSYKDHQLG